MLVDLASRIPCRRLIDIGCDHASVPLELLRAGHCQSVLVTDLRQGPLSAARRRAAREGAGPGFETLQTDGLDGLEIQRDDILLISGLGGETIADILGRHPDKARRPARLILQPQTREERLRECLDRLGLSILEEHCVEEGRQVYLVLVAGADGPEREALSPLEIYLGPHILQKYRALRSGRLPEGDRALEAYLRKRLRRLRKQAPHQGSSQALLDEFQSLLELP